MTETSTSTIAPELLDPTIDPPAPVTPGELAAFLAARMCHDYISPAGAIMSGLDLLEDPSAQDMREEAMTLIASSAKKLVDLLSFDRVALGASAAAESFGADQLETLAVGVSTHGRAQLVWNCGPRSLPKPAARAMLNLVQIGLGALPTGGTATLTAVEADGGLVLSIDCVGARARLRRHLQDGNPRRPHSQTQPSGWPRSLHCRTPRHPDSWPSHPRRRNGCGSTLADIADTDIPKKTTGS